MRKIETEVNPSGVRFTKHQRGKHQSKNFGKKVAMVYSKTNIERYEFDINLAIQFARYRHLGTYIGLALWGAVLIGIFVCLGIYGWKSVLGFITAAADQARMQAYFWDLLLFFSLLVVVGVCVLPGFSMVELTCGFVLGFKEGFLVNFFGTLTASTVSFALGRYYLKESINNFLDDDKFLKAIERKNGLGLLILFRLMFLPFFVKNYGPAVIESTTWSHYILAVVLTSPAYSALFAFMGSEAKSIADIAAGGGSGFTYLQLVPVLVSVLAGCIFTWMAYIEFQSLTHCDEKDDEEDGLQSLLTASQIAG